LWRQGQFDYASGAETLGFNGRLFVKPLRLLLLVFLIVGLIGAKQPPHLKWRGGNCWLLGTTYALLRMPQLKEFALANETKFVDGSFERAYAGLVRAINDRPGDPKYYATELQALQRAAEQLFGAKEGAWRDPFEYFERLHVFVHSKKSSLFGPYLQTLIDLKINDSEPLSLGVENFYKSAQDPLRSARKFLQGPQEVGKASEELVPAIAVKYPDYLLCGFFVCDWKQKLLVHVPLILDTAEQIDSTLGTFKQCEYELVVLTVRQNDNHYVTYVYDDDGKHWYCCVDGHKAPYQVSDTLLKENEKLWSKNFYPRLLLYKRTKLIPRKKDPAQDALEKLAGSLKTLTATLGGK